MANGVPLELEQPAVSDVVQTLEALLAEARAGKIKSIGAVYSYGPHHTAITATRLLPMELFAGCRGLADAIYGAMTGGAPSRVLRPFGN